MLYADCGHAIDSRVIALQTHILARSGAHAGLPAKDNDMSDMPFQLLAPIAAALILILAVAIRIAAERRPSSAASRRNLASQRVNSDYAPANSPVYQIERDLEGLRRTAADIEVRELLSPVELANELLDAGHTDGAARVLAEFIETHPKQAVIPWLKLLEIYRKSGGQEEYENIARGLHEHFNIRMPAWNQPLPAATASGIEDHTHVIAEIARRWGTHACHRYLGRLLADNRGGSRRGFGIDALDDILFLTDVLEVVLAASHDKSAGGVAHRKAVRSNQLALGQIGAHLRVVGGSSAADAEDHGDSQAPTLSLLACAGARR